MAKRRAYRDRFFVVLFFVADRLVEEDFFALLRFVDVERELVFFADFFFAVPFLGIFAPASRASLNAMAMACLRFFTLARPPDFSSPCLYSCITFSTFPRPRDEDELRLEREELDFLVATRNPPWRVDVATGISVSLMILQEDYGFALFTGAEDAAGSGVRAPPFALRGRYSACRRFSSSPEMPESAWMSSRTFNLRR